jgi:hypothetical protein
MVSYSPNGPFVPRVPTPFVPKNRQSLIRNPQGSASSGVISNNLVYAPNGPFVPRVPTDFIPKNAQLFTGGQPVPQAQEMDIRGIDAAERNRLMQNALMSRGQQEQPAAAPAVGGMGVNPIQAMFAPLFQDLKRQRQLANKRYEANSQQVTNIYGQITGARSEDIGTLETAFKRLVDAASTRSQAVNTGIDESEAMRLQQNQAALQSMGLEGLSTSQGDIASQTAAQAQQVNTLNSANWENMLRTMGATAQEQARADISGYNYAMAEDLGQLRGAREEFLQDLGGQRLDLKAKRAQATFEYQQAQQRAAASAKAAEQRAMMQMATEAQKQAAAALKESGPVLSTVSTLLGNGALDSPESGARVIQTINEWFENVPHPAGPMGRWNAGTAKNSILEAAGPTLSNKEKTAIEAIFNKLKW